MDGMLVETGLDQNRELTIFALLSHTHTRRKATTQHTEGSKAQQHQEAYFLRRRPKKWHARRVELYTPRGTRPPGRCQTPRGTPQAPPSTRSNTARLSELIPLSMFIPTMPRTADM